MCPNDDSVGDDRNRRRPRHLNALHRPSHGMKRNWPPLFHRLAKHSHPASVRQGTRLIRAFRIERSMDANPWIHPRAPPALIAATSEDNAFLHDSERTYKTMRFEYETAWPHLKTPGLLLTDNVHGTQAFRDFVRNQQLKTWITFDGLGAIRKEDQRNVP
jgi:hypothetical protein